MTTAIVVIIGAGILLIISAIENSPLLATFQAVWQGKPLSSLATSSSGTSGNNPPGGTPKPPGPISIAAPPIFLSGNASNTSGINKL